MNKVVIIFLTIIMLSSFAFATDRNAEVNSNQCQSSFNSQASYPETVREMWDILLYFETPASSQSGIATDGNFIYTSSFSTELFRKFEMDGTFVEDFAIQGISTCNCLTYDGTYFYGAKGNLSDGIFVLDLENQTLINTIPVSAPSIIAIGHIAYDPGLDNGNGGFWVGYWHELAAVDMNGNEIIPDLWTGGATLSCSGTAYDSITDPANPSLFLFRQSGASDMEISKFDINSQTFGTEILHVATDIPGPSGGSTSSVASGLYSFINRNGKLVLLGMIDCFPGNEMVFEYEISNAFVYTNDIGVQSLVSPITGNNLSSTETVTVSILNNGTVAQSNFDIQYTIDDGTGVIGPFTKNVTETIDPDEQIEVTFDDTADLSAPGDYSIVVTSLLAGDENAANDVLIKVVTNTSGTYPPASGGSGPGQEYISNITIGDVSNNSGADNYADYSGDPDLYIYLEPDVASQLTITLANPYNNDIGAVWVDWNLDYDFSTDERIFLSAMGHGPYITDVIAPEDALTNTILRMRIRMEYDNPDPSPYGFTSFGEVEDYTIIVNGPQLDPPTNVNAEVYDEVNVLVTWNAPAGAVLSYNVYRDGTSIGNTTDISYDDMDLEPGTYVYGVSAVYDDGESIIVFADEVTIEEPVFNPPQNLAVDPYSGYATWEAPVGGGQLYELIQHNGDAMGSYVESFDNGYGVVYDVSGYTNVTLEMLDFHHSSWGVYGTWDYALHIVDWDTYTEVVVVTGLQTTGDDIWEENIDLGSVSETGLVGVFMEPMSDIASEAYPCINFDGEGTNGLSYLGPLADYSAMSLSIIGDFLMDLWIMAEETDVVVQAKRFEANFSSATSRVESSIPDIEFITLNQTSILRDILGYNVYLNGTLDGFTTDLFYQYTGLINGVTYLSEVTALYDDGESTPIEYEFIYTGVSVDDIVNTTTSLKGNYPNPFNPSTTISFDTAQTSSFVNLEIYNMKGQKVKTLVNGALASGKHKIIWKGKDDSGKPVSSGIYFYKIKTGNYTSTKKMILLK